MLLKEQLKYLFTSFVPQCSSRNWEKSGLWAAFELDQKEVGIMNTQMYTFAIFDLNAEK